MTSFADVETTSRPGGVRFRLLWHEVVVHADDDTAALVEAMTPPVTFRQGLVTTERLSLSVHRHEGDRVVVDEDRALTERVATAREAADVVYGHAHRTAFEHAAAQGWIRLHGLVADHPASGARLVATGSSGVGKTTLALALLATGWDVQGDESLILREGAGLAVPRPFQVKPGSFERVAAVSPWADTAKELDHLPGVRIVTPHQADRPWRTTLAAVDHLAVLGRHDGPTRLEGLETPAALEALREQLFTTTEAASTLANGLGALVVRARLHRLLLGDDALAPSILTEALA